MRTYLLSALCILAVHGHLAAQQTRPVADLTLLVTPELPCVWPTGMMQHAVIPSRTFGPGPYHRDLILIDEHTGTQFDAPAHFVPPPSSGLPGAGPMGLITAEKVPAWQFGGEACVIDVTKHVDAADAGASFLITPEIIQAWEKENRKLAFGDVVLFYSGYSDKYYQPYPAGERFVHYPLRATSPGWPAPTPQAMKYVASKGVMTLGLDSPSMGPLPTLAAATHQAGGELGMVWAECLGNLGSLPKTGAFFTMLAPKHASGSGAECRAIAVAEPKLAARLIESSRKKRVADLSVTLDESYPVTWPGHSAGEEASRYVGKALNYFDPARGPYFTRTHMLDGQVGTHVVLPSYSLPPKNFDNAKYSPDVQKSLAAFEARYGKRGTSELSAADAPLEQMIGEAHVIDVRVRRLVREVDDEATGSLTITLEMVKEHEKKRPIRAGEVVLFFSGYSDKHFKPLPPAPAVDRCFAAPLAGKAPGWPAPTPEVIAYLAEKGVRCIGTDGPTLGGTDREQALDVYWLAGSRNVLLVEYLTNLDEIADKPAYFVFAPVKIRNARGGYGRAVAYY